MNGRLSSSVQMVSSYNPCYDLPYIACTTLSRLAWVRTGTCCIQLICNGAVRDTIHTDFGFSDVTVIPQGDVLFSDYINKRIVTASKRATSRRITPLFSTQCTPCGICSLRNSDVVVTFYDDSRVILYSSDGDIIHEFDPELFSHPYRAAVNKINESLYVTDTGTKKLVAFDKDHRLQYEYTGSDALSFYPRDVTTDISGRVLITDEDNNKIHVLNQDGEFLQYIQLPGLEKPWYIDVDNMGRAWIGEYEGEVKIVKY